MRVLYPGSFDPLTNGHVNIVNRALKCFDKIIVAVAVNSNKDSILDIDERVKAINKVFQKSKKVQVDSFEGLLVHYARKKKLLLY